MQPLSHSAATRVAGAATKPLSHSEWLSGWVAGPAALAEWLSGWVAGAATLADALVRVAGPAALPEWLSGWVAGAATLADALVRVAGPATQPLSHSEWLSGWVAGPAALPEWLSGWVAGPATLGEWLSGWVAEWPSGWSSRSGRVAEWLSGWVAGPAAQWPLTLGEWLRGWVAASISRAVLHIHSFWWGLGSTRKWNKMGISPGIDGGFDTSRWEAHMLDFGWIFCYRCGSENKNNWKVLLVNMNNMFSEVSNLISYLNNNKTLIGRSNMTSRGPTAMWLNLPRVPWKSLDFACIYCSSTGWWSTVSQMRFLSPFRPLSSRKPPFAPPRCGADWRQNPCFGGARCGACMDA